MGYEISGDKQRINLSNYAYYILRCDNSAFTNQESQCEHISSTFLNRIFLNFYKESASRKEYQTKEYQEALAEAVTSKGQGFNFTLQKETQKVLGTVEKNYPTAGKYLKSVYEEYALLPYYRREEIYFRETIRTIRMAIRASQMLTCRYYGKEVEMWPFCIRLDEWSSYNYLVAVNPGGWIVTCRISYMEEVEGKDPVLDLTPEERKEYKSRIESKIQECGVQFLIGEAEDITIRMTEKGKNMYDHMCFLRPQYIGKSEVQNPGEEKYYLYRFRCTQKQAEYYFFKMGADAVVLEPEGLREKFRSQYQQALDNYL